MKPFIRLLVVLAVLFACLSFLQTISPAAGFRRQGEASWTLRRTQRIKRDVASNQTSTKITNVQNSTATPATTNRQALTVRFPVFGRRTTLRRNRITPSGSFNFTGLTEKEIEAIRGKNKSAVELDHLGFPVLPNSNRGNHSANYATSKPRTENNGQYPDDVVGEIRTNGSRTSTSRPNSTDSEQYTTDSEQYTTDSEGFSSEAPYSEAVDNKDYNGHERKDISSVIAEHSTWIAVVASLLLSAFACLMVNVMRQKRRGKLVITPVNSQNRPEAAVVFKA